MTARFSAVIGFLTLLCASIPTAWGQDAVGALERSLDDAPGTRSVLRPKERESGYLGISVDLVAPEGKSVYVLSVADGGPAAKAGLKANDVIVEVNRQPIGGLDDLDRVVRQPAGTKLEFQVRRDGALQRVSVTLEERPKDEERPAPAGGSEPADDELPPPPPPAAEPRTEMPDRPTPDATMPRTDGGPSVVQGSRPILGISVADISDLTKRRFGVTVDTGAVISNIREGTPAALAGLPLGGVIVSINGRRIGSANDIVEIVQAFRPGDDVEVTYFEGDRVGRKRIRLGRTAVAVVPATPPATEGDMAAPTEPPLQLGRRRGERPLLDALERTLDAVLSPTPEARSPEDAAPLPPPTPGAGPTDPQAADMIPPPVPPTAPGEADADLPAVELEPPAANLPAPTGDAKELEELRSQAQTLQKQLELLLRRIEELEQKETPPAPAAGGTTRR